MPKDPSPARPVHSIRLLHRGVLAVLGAAAITIFAAGSALAITPPGTVSVETTGCSFVVHVDLDQQPDVVGWSVNASTKVDWDDGKTVLHGSTSTDADGNVDIGPLTADAGEYNVVVDDEVPVDSSSIVEHFTLSCEAAVPTPTPTGEEQPAAGTPKPKPHPTGQEEAATGNGGAVGGISATPPPTETGVATSEPSTGPSWLVLAMIGAVSIATFAISSRRFGAVRARGRTGRTRS